MKIRELKTKLATITSKRDPSQTACGQQSVEALAEAIAVATATDFDRDEAKAAIEIEWDSLTGSGEGDVLVPQVEQILRDARDALRRLGVSIDFEPILEDATLKAKAHVLLHPFKTQSTTTANTNDATSLNS